MNNRIKLSLVVFFTCLVTFCFSQGAKKPKIMIVPSDALLKKMDLLRFEINSMGKEVKIKNYERAFLDDELKAVISKFSEMMKERGFPLLMMEKQLEKISKRKGRQLNYDIEIGLNYKIMQTGPRKSLYVEFSGIDNYTDKQIAAASGESAPAIGASTISLLQEAVLDKIDAFNSQLMDEFNQMVVKGRESVLYIESSDYDLEEEINGKPIIDHVEEWLTANCVNSNFSVDDSSSEYIEVTQSMMPLFNNKNKALDARNFYKPLVKMLKGLLSAEGYTCKGESNRLSEVIIKIQE